MWFGISSEMALIFVDKRFSFLMPYVSQAQREDVHPMPKISSMSYFRLTLLKAHVSDMPK